MPETTLIKDGLVLDGTGGEPERKNVWIRDGLLVEPDGNPPAAVVFDAADSFVTPAFIDAHSNLTQGPLLDPLCQVATRQGIGTAITGNCGGSIFPLIGEAESWIRQTLRRFRLEPSWKDVDGYAQALGALAIDIVPMVGHSTLRAAAAGFVDRELLHGEMEQLLLLTDTSFLLGAQGISFGLSYPPGAYAGHAELQGVCEVAAAYGRVAAFHIRLESRDLLKSVDEVCNLAFDSGVRCIICHHKALGRANWGQTSRTLARIELARDRGASIFLDMYPYTSAVRNLAMLLPDHAHAGGRGELVQRLRDPRQRNELAKELHGNVRDWDSDWTDTTILSAPATPNIEGRRASGVVEDLGLVGLLEALAENDGRIMTMYEGASWEDLQKVASCPWSMIGSDGDAQLLSDSGHPRSFETFPRFINELVWNRGTLTLGEAVRRATGLPSEVWELSDRGRLKAGLRGDVCVFSKEDLRNGNTEDEVSGGRVWVRHLLVGGRPVIRDHRATENRPGSAIRRT